MGRRDEPPPRGRHACVYLAVAFFAALLLATVCLLGPAVPEFYVESASLARFGLSDDGRCISYGLSADVSVRDPSKDGAVGYGTPIKAELLYGREPVATWIRTLLPGGLEQGRDNTTTTVLHTVFAGESTLKDRSGIPRLFGAQSDRGAFDMELRVSFENPRFGGASCSLRGLRRLAAASSVAASAAAAPDPASPPASFSRTKCTFAPLSRFSHRRLGY